MSHLQSIDIPGAYYYVQLEGNGQRQLLTTRQDFEHFRQLLAPMCEASNSKLLGYCLFQDSLHLVIRAGQQSIVAAIQWLVDTHTQHYNQRHQRNGSVFSPQLLTTLIDPHHYLLPVIYQLHWLPVAVGLVSSPSAYPWSSHRDYLSADAPEWLDRQEVLVKVANHRASQLRRYEHFIENSQQPSVDWIEGVGKEYQALASDSYIEALLDDNNRHQIPPVIDINSLTEWICEDYQIQEKDLLMWRHHRLSGEIQAVIGALALTFGIADEQQIAEHFDCDLDVLASGIRALQSRRGMYLFKLQLRLNQWLVRNVETASVDQNEIQTRVDEETVFNHSTPSTSVDNGEIQNDFIEDNGSQALEARPELIAASEDYETVKPHA